MSVIVVVSPADDVLSTIDDAATIVIVGVSYTKCFSTLSTVAVALNLIFCYRQHVVSLFTFRWWHFLRSTIVVVVVIPDLWLVSLVADSLW